MNKIIDLINESISEGELSDSLGLAQAIEELIAPELEKARTFDNILSGNCSDCPAVDFCVEHDEHPCEMLRDALTEKEPR